MGRLPVRGELGDIPADFDLSAGSEVSGSRREVDLRGDRRVVHKATASGEYSPEGGEGR